MKAIILYSFKNKMASKLPIGRKIFSSNDRKDLLIIENKE